MPRKPNPIPDEIKEEAVRLFTEEKYKLVDIMKKLKLNHPQVTICLAGVRKPTKLRDANYEQSANPGFFDEMKYARENII